MHAHTHMPHSFPVISCMDTDHVCIYLHACSCELLIHSSLFFLSSTHTQSCVAFLPHRDQRSLLTHFNISSVVYFQIVIGGMCSLEHIHTYKIYTAACTVPNSHVHHSHAYTQINLHTGEHHQHETAWSMKTQCTLLLCRTNLLSSLSKAVDSAAAAVCVCVRALLYVYISCHMHRRCVKCTFTCMYMFS